MAIERLDIASVTPYEVDGWELVAGTAHFAVDPAHPANAGIVDLALVPTTDGRVRYDADFRYVRPAGREPDRLLFVVPNRGFIGGLPFSIGAAAWGASGDAIPAGDALPLQRGWAVAFCGWQWDIASGLGLRAPIATQADGSPVTGWLRVEFRAEAPQADKHLSDSSPMFAFAAYPTADLDDPDAVLTRREFLSGPRTVVPRERWRFARDVDGHPVADAEHIWLEGGFEPHHIYEVVYRTAHNPVAGTGLLAVRDFVSHLRHTSGITHTLGLGISQCGRFLRQFLYEGRNRDESGQRVFDGVFAHIAGGRRGEFNHRFAQPSVTHTPSFGNLPPFTDAELLSREQAQGTLPKVFFANTSWEYWRGDAAQLHIAGTSDCVAPAEVRDYHIAGTDHIGSMVQMKQLMPIANAANPLGGDLVNRALFVALDRWVTEGVEPPASRVPRLADGTAARRTEVLAALAQVTDLVLPDEHAMHQPHAVDLGPEADAGIGRYPIELGPIAPDYVSAVDADGNEVAGIQLPQLRAPVGVFTGFNPRRRVAGKPTVMLEFVGSFAPFDADELERRYPDEEAYLTLATRAAAELVEQGFLLPDDAARAAFDAVKLYRKVTATTQENR